MGLMRFHIFPPERITDEMVQQAYLSGIDRAAWPVRVSIENGMLLMHRSVSDSANLHIPWPLEGGDPLIFSTASLMEQETPYLLPLEIARGTVSQLTDQLFEWKSIGLLVPDALTALVIGINPAIGRGRYGPRRSGRRRQCWPKRFFAQPPRPLIGWRRSMSNRHCRFGGAARGSLRVF